MAFGYRYTLETQENGWTLVRFPGIPEALTEGDSEAEARANALDCVIAALEGYMKAGRPLPRSGAGIAAPIAPCCRRSSPRNWRCTKRCAHTAGLR